MTMVTRLSCVCLALTLSLLVGNRAQADLTAYDPFNDTAVGDPLVQTSDPATGFSGEWVPGGYNAGESTNYTVASGSLAYGALLTNGNHVSTDTTSVISGASRDFAAALGAAGTTEYFSVLLRPDGALNGGLYENYFGVYLNSLKGQDIFIGKPGGGAIGDYVVETRGGVSQVDTGLAAVTGQTVLLVLRADFTAGVDTFTLYVDPTPGGLEPSSGAIKQDTDVGNLTGLMLYSTGAFSIDEFRTGTTYASVVPTVPEPSSVVLFAIGGLGALGAFRLNRHVKA